MSELEHLHRQGDLGADLLHQFALVHDDDLLERGGGDDLLAEQCPSESLDEVHLGIHLVCTVDGDIDIIDVVEVDDGDAVLKCQTFGCDGCGDAFQVVALLDELGDLEDDVVCGGACSESDGHAVLHELLNSLLSRKFLHLVLVDICHAVSPC